VGRLVEQKGVDLILQLGKRIAGLPLQLVILGSGEKRLETALLRAADKHPEQIAIRIGYNEGLAHRVEAGSDAFLMPSRFEPCGLNQLYSLRYGTLPIVHAVGGLADTVVDSNPQTLEDHTATGFSFQAASASALLRTLKRAIQLHGQAKAWQQVMHNAMRQRFDWRASARQYLQLYADAVGEKR
jgi:starch synthase